MNDGEVLHTIQRSTNIILESKFVHNYAMNDGGVVHSYQSTITLSKCSFDSNNAMNDGGVIHMWQIDASSY